MIVGNRVNAKTTLGNLEADQKKLLLRGKHSPLIISFGLTIIMNILEMNELRALTKHGKCPYVWLKL